MEDSWIMARSRMGEEALEGGEQQQSHSKKSPPSAAAFAAPEDAAQARQETLRPQSLGIKSIVSSMTSPKYFQGVAGMPRRGTEHKSHPSLIETFASHGGSDKASTLTPHPASSDYVQKARIHEQEWTFGNSDPHLQDMFASTEVSDEYALLNNFLNNSLIDDTGLFVEMETPNGTNNQARSPSRATVGNSISRSVSGFPLDKAREVYYFTAADPARSDPPDSLPNPGLSGDSSRTGNDQRRHKCPYCATDFARHHNLKTHLLTHSQEKPFNCETCSARFRRLHDLKRHQKLHTGERPHMCNKCGRKFARGDALARHTGQGGCAGPRSSLSGLEYAAEAENMGRDEFDTGSRRDSEVMGENLTHAASNTGSGILVRSRYALQDILSPPRKTQAFIEAYTISRDCTRNQDQDQISQLHIRQLFRPP